MQETFLMCSTCSECRFLMCMPLVWGHHLFLLGYNLDLSVLTFYSLFHSVSLPHHTEDTVSTIWQQNAEVTPTRQSNKTREHKLGDSIDCRLKEKPPTSTQHMWNSFETWRVIPKASCGQEEGQDSIQEAYCTIQNIFNSKQNICIVHSWKIYVFMVLIKVQ